MTKTENRNAVLGDLLQSNRVYLVGGDWPPDCGGDSSGLGEGGGFTGVQDLLVHLTWLTTSQ